MFLNAVAVLAAQGFAKDAGDSWDISGPDTQGDCEDKALWAAHVIATRDPELRRSMAAIAWRDGNTAHMVLAVFTDRGVFIIDGANYSRTIIPRAELTTRSGYPGQVYIASNGVSREWIRLN